jgi:hypothetical protein
VELLWEPPLCTPERCSSPNAFYPLLTELKLETSLFPLVLLGVRRDILVLNTICPCIFHWATLSLDGKQVLAAACFSASPNRHRHT